MGTLGEQPMPNQQRMCVCVCVCVCGTAAQPRYTVLPRTPRIAATAAASSGKAAKKAKKGKAEKTGEAAAAAADDADDDEDDEDPAAAEAGAWREALNPYTGDLYYYNVKSGKSAHPDGGKGALFEESDIDAEYVALVFVFVSSPPRGASPARNCEVECSAAGQSKLVPQQKRGMCLHPPRAGTSAAACGSGRASR